MTTQILELDVMSRRDIPGVVCVRVAGDVDPATAPALRETLTAVVARDPAAVEMDLSAVTFFSCAGLGVLAAARNHVDGRLTVVAAAPPVRRVLHLLGLESAFAPPAGYVAAGPESAY